MEFGGIEFWGRIFLLLNELIENIDFVLVIFYCNLGDEFNGYYGGTNGVSIGIFLIVLFLLVL